MTVEEKKIEVLEKWVTVLKLIVDRQKKLITLLKEKNGSKETPYAEAGLPSSSGEQSKLHA